MGRSGSPRWAESAERAELRSVYAEVDALVEGWTCRCSAAGASCSSGPDCCHFAVTGREPYPTAVELQEVRHGMAAISLGPRDHHRLPLSRAPELRPCPLLSDQGRCRIYASRPFGCRTFFCDHAEAPFGARARLPRDPIHALGRRVADLSARFAPRDAGPRPLLRALLTAR